ncbi:DUF1499 domain-containing protein [Halovulum sp. GXIMD14794]
MKTMFMVILLGVLGLAGYLAYAVRTVTHDPAIWHVEPLQALPSDSPNDYRVALTEFTEHRVDREAPVYAADARTLAAAFDEFVMAQPRVERVAGTVDEAWLTYVQRTETLMMPDYISVRFYDLDPEVAEAQEAETAQATTEGDDASDGEASAIVQTSAEPRASIALYSRSRFGYGDMGVNEARVTAWMRALDSFVVEE